MTHLAYDGTLQTIQLALVSAKLRSSLMLEGQMPEDGLAALEEDEGDTFVQLARRLTNEDGAADLDAEAAFTELQSFEAEGNDDLLTEEAKAELARAYVEQPDAPTIVERPIAREPSPAPLPSLSLGAGSPPGDAGPADAADGAPADGPIPGPSRQLSFLELRAELARRGAKLPRPRARKPTPGQVSLFD